MRVIVPLTTIIERIMVFIPALAKVMRLSLNPNRIIPKRRNLLEIKPIPEEALLIV